MRTTDFRFDAFRHRPVLKSIRTSRPWVRGMVCLAAVIAVSLPAGVSQQTQPFTVGLSGDPQPRDISTWPPINPLANRTADPNRILEDSMKLRDYRKRMDQLNLVRHKEMTTDTEKLVALANQLKSETDKDTKASKETSSLSMESVRQAEQIEKLAHSVRDKMRATAGN